MAKDLQQKLKQQWDTFTASEQKIASHLLNNLREVPFETAASLGKRVGVSAMTVGRFLRSLGYDGLGELKEDLRGDGSWRHLYKDLEQPGGGDAVASHLQAEIRAVTGVHALAGTREWKAVIRLLLRADRVSVASFQNGAFLGMGFAAMLQQLRPRVAFDSGVDSAYVDMLMDSSADSCVVLIDMRRYYRQFRGLAEEVARRGIPLVLITDTDCYWARELTPHVLMVPAERMWHSFSPYISLFSLLLAGMVQEGGQVMGRIGEITRLRQELVGYVDARTGGEHPAPAGRKRRGKT